MLKPLQYVTRKKLKLARQVFETYKKLHNLEKTGVALGLATNTVRKYVALIEDINENNKVSNKDNYYNNNINTKECPPPVTGSYDNRDIGNCQGEIKNNIEDDNLETETILESEGSETDVFLANKVPDIRATKNKILAEKLDTIAFKYLEYLDNPSEQQLHRTSLKDRAVIAGILLDKKSQLEHKDADVIKNQSIIFNLFGDNHKLSEFITGNMKRQQALRERPVNKYTPAISK